jgi:CBS domain-containing protein
MILGFNLLPAFPLDGGRVARALLWRTSGDRLLATDRAAAVGRFFAVLIAAVGVLALGGGLFGGAWLLVVAAFLYVDADAEARFTHLEQALGGHTVAELAVPPVTLPAAATLEEAIRAFAAQRFTAFPVVDEQGRAVGLLTIARVRAVAAAARAQRTAGEVADRDPELRVAASEPAMAVLQRPAFARVGRAVVVDDAGRAIGLVSRTDIERVMRVGELDRGHDQRLQPR